MLYIVIGLPLMMLFLAQVIVIIIIIIIIIITTVMVRSCFKLIWLLLSFLQIGNLMADGIKTGYSRLACRQILTFTSQANFRPSL